MSQNDAWGVGPKNATLIRDATSALALPLAASAVIFCGLAGEILRFVTVPATWENILVFQLLTIGVTVSLLSTPAGNFLSATAYARTASVIGVSTLLLGIVLWAALVPLLGVVGTAAGYSILMVARGAANIVISNRRMTWWSFPAQRGLAVTGVLVLSTVIAYPWCPAGRRVALVGVNVLAIGLLMLPELLGLAVTMLPLLKGRSERT